MLDYKSPRDWSPRGEIPGQPIWPKFVDAYLEAALWASIDEDGEPFDKNYGVEDFAQETVDHAIKISNDFITANRADLERVGDESRHGHDFWLTRNGHGAGFWDRGYGAVGERLSEMARPYGEANVYVGDDGKLYISG